jgi:hypothetical protein
VAVALRKALLISFDDLLALAIGLEPMAPRWRGLRDLQRACPIRIRTTPTDRAIGAPLVRATRTRWMEFTDRLFGLRKRAATGAHAFDRLCAELGIEHRLTPPASPRTNGMVQRFNGRIEEVLQSRHFRSGEDLETTLHRTVRLCNQQLPQSALGSKSPLQAMKDWHKRKPQLFRKRPYYLPGCDTNGPIRDWVCGPGRALEIQDFCRIGVLERDHADLIAAWQQALDGHSGPRWIHGPFFGLDIATPDSEVRAVMQKRVLQRLAVAEALGADLMVIHSPFTHWHQLKWGELSLCVTSRPDRRRRLPRPGSGARGRHRMHPHAGKLRQHRPLRPRRSGAPDRAPKAEGVARHGACRHLPRSL